MFQTIGRKITFTCAVLVSFTFVVFLIAMLSMGRMAKAAHLIVTDSQPGIYHMLRVRGDVVEFRGDTWKHIATKDPAAKAKLDADNEKILVDIDSELKRYEATITTQADREPFQKVRQTYDQWIPLMRKVRGLSSEGKEKEAAEMFVASRSYREALQQALDSAVELNKKQGDAFAAESEAATTFASSAMWSVLAAAILCGSLLAFYIVKTVNASLGEATAELSEGAAQVASAANQVSISSQSLAQGVSRQAASLQETSSSAQEVSAMTRRNAENSSVTAGIMLHVSQQIDAGNQKLTEMISSMQEINNSSVKISKIIKAIDEIAFQTNILALNAAVEAARAGDAGMGFAVVADEVRSLAQRCALAAQDTTSLIEESMHRCSQGAFKLDELGCAINRITEETTKAKTLVDEVCLGSNDQVRHLDNISSSIGQMEQVTQNSAANAEQGAAAGEQLSAQSQSLQEVISRLESMVGVNTASKAPSTPTSPQELV